VYVFSFSAAQSRALKFVSDTDGKHNAALFSILPDNVFEFAL
jgi:hypothetical protein